MHLFKHDWKNVLSSRRHCWKTETHHNRTKIIELQVYRFIMDHFSASMIGVQFSTELSLYETVPRSSGQGPRGIPYATCSLSHVAVKAVPVSFNKNKPSSTKSTILIDGATIYANEDIVTFDSQENNSILIYSTYLSDLKRGS